MPGTAQQIPPSSWPPSGCNQPIQLHMRVASMQPAAHLASIHIVSQCCAFLVPGVHIMAQRCVPCNCTSSTARLDPEAPKQQGRPAVSSRSPRPSALHHGLHGHLAGRGGGSGGGGVGGRGGGVACTRWRGIRFQGQFLCSGTAGWEADGCRSWPPAAPVYAHSMPAAARHACGAAARQRAAIVQPGACYSS